MDQHAFRFESWAISHRGRVRELNEDRYLLEPELGLWVVADGMGGHDAGEVASAEIVSRVATVGIPSSHADQQARFVDRLSRANDEILAYSAERGGAVAGSTVVAVLTYGERYTCYWMGDSRIYRIRRGEVTQLTRDHSEVQDLIDSGTLTSEDARTWPRRNVITRAVGAQRQLNLDMVGGTIEAGDAFILCSDGLTTYTEPADILDAVKGRRARDACDQLIDLALTRGGADNVTVVIIQCRPLDATVPAGFDELPEQV